jgi:predicted kinase
VRTRARGFYIILRGPLGIGKSTVARGLAARIGAQVISIDQVLEDHDLWSTGRLSEFLEANTWAVRTVRPVLRKGTPIIFDGNFYWKSQIDDLIGRLDFRPFVFTLEAPLQVCVERDSRRDRPYGSRAVQQVYAKSTRFDYGTAVDAARPIGAVLREITSQLPRDASPLPG